MTRRSFLGSAALALPAAAASDSPRIRLREFAYPQVKLTGGPLAAMYRRVQAHYLGLDEDRILKVYRQKAGMPAPGRDMGGWYDAEGFVPGHLIGQFISGLSRMYAHTGDPAAQAKARRLVQGYAATFEKDGNPVASPKASTTWPCYVLDKYEIGMLDAAALGTSKKRARCCRASFRAPCRSSRITPTIARPTVPSRRPTTSRTSCRRTSLRRMR